MNSLQKFITELFQTLFSLVKITLLSRYFVSFKKHKVTEEECVILGNGPCLKKDLERNGNFITARKKICVNFFALSKEYEAIKPEYYVLAAPEYWLQKTSDYFKTKKDELIGDLVNKTNWHMIILIPFQAKGSDFHTRVCSNKNIQFIFYNNTPVEGLKTINHFLFKRELGMPRPHNVLNPSIFLALNLGFKKIILYGADHSWHEEIKVDETNQVTINHEHFYDAQKVQLPMYKLDGKEYYVHDIFRKLHYAFKGYLVLKNYADHLGARILNASTKSYIDAFERIVIK
ncbi:MAG: hypothetical protein AB1521_09795 [Bacteroidota bacterium]